MSDFIGSEECEGYKIVIFRDKESRLFGFSIHEQQAENKWYCEAVAVHQACFDNVDEPMRKARALIYFLIDNDIDYHNISLGRKSCN